MCAVDSVAAQMSAIIVEENIVREYVYVSGSCLRPGRFAPSPSSFLSLSSSRLGDGSISPRVDVCVAVVKASIYWVSLPHVDSDGCVVDLGDSDDKRLERHTGYGSGKW